MSETPFPVTIFHNPRCGTSRNVVALVEAAGYAPTVVPYLTTGWTAAQLTDLAERSGEGLRGLLRGKEAQADALGLNDPTVSDAVLLAAMIAHPVLVNRPIVVTPLGVVLARPSEKVLRVLDRRPECFIKEDGEVVL